MFFSCSLATFSFILINIIIIINIITIIILLYSVYFLFVLFFCLLTHAANAYRVGVAALLKRVVLKRQTAQKANNAKCSCPLLCVC